MFKPWTWHWINIRISSNWESLTFTFGYFCSNETHCSDCYSRITTRGYLRTHQTATSTKGRVNTITFWQLPIEVVFSLCSGDESTVWNNNCWKIATPKVVVRSKIFQELAEIKIPSPIGKYATKQAYREAAAKRQSVITAGIQASLKLKSWESSLAAFWLRNVKHIPTAGSLMAGPQYRHCGEFVVFNLGTYIHNIHL